MERIPRSESVLRSRDPLERRLRLSSAERTRFVEERTRDEVVPVSVPVPPLRSAVDFPTGSPADLRYALVFVLEFPLHWRSVTVVRFRSVAYVLYVLL
jgi:hypothetical protein